MNRFCTSCGAALEEGARFCGECGTPAQASAPAQADTTAQAAPPAQSATVNKEAEAAEEKSINLPALDTKQLKEKANGFFAKLPFRAMAEKIPAGTRAKFPLLDKAIPFANHIACGLIAVIVIATIAASGAKDGGGAGGGGATSATGTSSGKSSDGGDKYYIYHGNDLLRVRSEPDTSADNIVHRLADSDKVVLLETGKMDSMDGINAPWFKVKTMDGKTGWVFSGYLTAITDTLLIEEAQAAEKAAAEAQKERDAAVKSGKAVLAPESDFEVKLNDAGDGAVITRYVGRGGNIIIPATIQGFPVTAVYMNPQANASLTSVVIPEGVKTVGGFKDCIALRSVTLPDSLTKLVYSNYTGAFQGCTSLASITIPGSVTSIDGDSTYNTGGMFSGCTSLASVTIGDGVTNIGNRAFKNCTSLASITIPDSVTRIGTEAFQGCKSLASITIPDGVTRINDYAFAGCTSLASIAIPDSVTIILERAFGGCTSLVTVTISPVKRERFSSAFENCPKLSLASQAAIKAALAAAERN